MTYRDLLAVLQTLTPDQLDCDLAIHLWVTDEIQSGADCGVTFLTSDDSEDRLDHGHPVFCVRDA